MIYLDHFKRVNDTYGHSAGDRVLQLVADLLQRHVRSADIVCRYGGEEFAVLLPDTTLDHALARAEELRHAAEGLELPGPAAGNTLSLSVGVAAFPLHGRRAADLVRASDAALYAAKRNGRNRVETPPQPAPAPAS
jgi:diguanylate cyclase (GGDEF)-like protein